MGWLEAVPLGQVLNGGGWAVAFWAILYVARMVYTGKLVPQKTHEDTVKALEIERIRNELLLKQLERATDSMEVFENFVRSLPRSPQGPLRVESRQGEVERPRSRRTLRTQDWGGRNPPGQREDGE